VGGGTRDWIMLVHGMNTYYPVLNFNGFIVHTATEQRLSVKIKCFPTHNAHGSARLLLQEGNTVPVPKHHVMKSQKQNSAHTELQS
jgi:hypothetical protein